MPTTRRLVLLPGLGADARLFEPQRAAFPGLEVPDWLPNLPGETLPAYARRMTATITPSPGFILGGASFGGMVALEMAQYLQPAAVILIASCRTGDAIAPHLRYFVKFAGILPERVFAAGQGLTPLFIQKFGRMTPGQREQFEAILSDVTPAFVRWGIEAITNWEGNLALPMPVYHIHGSDDELIPVKSVRADRVIAAGGHLINVTHAAEVNAFITQCLG